jgi:hypothetical protein
MDSHLYIEVPQFIPRSHLENAIAALRGTDKRTIVKWLKDLEKYGCIKTSSMFQYKFV